jgi:hypothetical protein
VQSYDPPSNWEALAARSPDWLSDYGPTSGLERWEREELKRLDAADRERKKPLSLDAVTAMLRPHVSPDIGPVERELVSGLALSIWGAEHAEAAVARRREQKLARTAFGGINTALAFALYRSADLGAGAISYKIAEDKYRPNPNRVGYDYMPAKQTSNGTTHVRGLDVIDLQKDAWSAIRAAALAPIDLWLVEITTFGAREEVVSKVVKEIDPETQKPRKRTIREIAPVKRPKTQAIGAGWRNKVPRKEAAEMLRLKAQTALQVVRASLAAFPPPPPEALASLRAQRDALVVEAEITDRAVSERITRARKAIMDALVERNLIPPQKASAARPLRASVPLDLPRQPIRPQFAGALR